MLADTTRVDYITRDASGDSYALFVVVEDGEWDRDDWVELLQVKITNYATYVLDGQMVEHYPECKGCPVRIAIHSNDRVPEEARAIVDQIEKALAQYELTVTFEPLP